MLAAHNPEPQFHWLDGIAIVVFALGVIGESLADAQLRRFKQNAAPHTVCDKGLWAWSRHPNYFCEWLCWCAFPLLAIGSTFAAGWLGLLAPIFMYWTLVYASGIPPLEAHMRRTRPEAFAVYERQTNAFFPASPRRV
jgi:steroid 5-alpha reductase family enzyme